MQMCIRDRYLRIPLIQQVRTESVTEIITQEFGFRTTTVGTTSSSSEYEDVPEEAIMILSLIHI